MAKRRSKSKTVTCACAAYPFPHKVGGGRCRRRKAIRYAGGEKRKVAKRVRRARREGRYLPNR